MLLLTKADENFFIVSSEKEINGDGNHRKSTANNTHDKVCGNPNLSFIPNNLQDSRYTEINTWVHNYEWNKSVQNVLMGFHLRFLL